MAAPFVLPELIDTPDGFEVVRARIAQLIALNQAAQQALATTAGKDPTQWELRVFEERSNPWEQWLDPRDPGFNPAPIVNVWYESGSFNQAKGSTVRNQMHSGTFNVDCYGVGVARDAAVGHTAGDQSAAENAQRALRLVRNFIMSEQNTYLQLRGIVGTRWPTSIISYQPEIQNESALQVVGIRLALSVEFAELSPEQFAEVLELVNVGVYREGDGRLLVETEFDYTAP